MRLHCVVLASLLVGLVGSEEDGEQVPSPGPQSPKPFIQLNRFPWYPPLLVKVGTSQRSEEVKDPQPGGLRGLLQGMMNRVGNFFNGQGTAKTEPPPPAPTDNNPGIMARIIQLLTAGRRGNPQQGLVPQQGPPPEEEVPAEVVPEASQEVVHEEEAQIAVEETVEPTE